MNSKLMSLGAIGVFFALSPLVACKQEPEYRKPGLSKTYLLVHGANHGAWAWVKVVPLLLAQGHKVVAIDLPGHGADKTPPETITFNDYVSKVVDVAHAQSGPVILVGHSAGGVTIAQAAEQLGINKVEKMIYLDAFLPKDGESVFALAAKFLPPDPTGDPGFAGSFVFDPGGATFTLDTTKVAHFLFHDCATSDVAFAKANLGKQPVAPFATPVKVTDSVYGAIPKYYIICSEAKNGDMTQMATNVPLQKLVSLRTSHSPFFSQPEVLTELMASF
jgi:pimeloyl-ACP methyl ester carboxylesterase